MENIGKESFATLSNPRTLGLLPHPILKSRSLETDPFQCCHLASDSILGYLAMDMDNPPKRLLKLLKSRANVDLDVTGIEIQPLYKVQKLSVCTSSP
jgi:hypothetical protein